LENLDFEKEKFHIFGYRQKGGCGGRGTVKTARLLLFCSEKVDGDQFQTLSIIFSQKDNTFPKIREFFS
jgi:hypothetical protein